MENIKLISAGKIVGVHGIRGGIKIHSNLESPENFATYKKFYIDGKEMKLALNFVKGNIAVVHLEGIRKREQAEEMVGKEIFIDKTEMPGLKGNEFYYSDLIGLKVMENGRHIGNMIDVANHGAGDIFEIEFLAKEKGTKFYPFKKTIFPKIDIPNGTVEMNSPEEEFDN